MEIHVERGNDVHLPCNIQGNPFPIFTWVNRLSGLLCAMGWDGRTSICIQVSTQLAIK